MTNKPITRRELFKEMASKDTLKKVVGTWYGFSKPITETIAKPQKKEGLFEKVQRLNMKNVKKVNQNGKEG